MYQALQVGGWYALVEQTVLLLGVAALQASFCFHNEPVNKVLSLKNFSKWAHRV